MNLTKELCQLTPKPTQLNGTILLPVAFTQPYLALLNKKKTIGREKQGKSWSVADYGFLIWDFGVHSKPWARRRLHSDQQKNASIQWTKKRTERGLLSLEARRGARTHNLEIPLILRVRVSRATDCASRAGCS